MPTEQDEVSAMQDAVDQLALSMFDALRLIPFSEEVKAGKRGGVGQPGQHDPDAAVVKRAVAMDSSWATHVQSLAEGVLKQARTVDGLIDTLPGADLREDQQMEASAVVVFVFSVILVLVQRTESKRVMVANILYQILDGCVAKLLHLPCDERICWHILCKPVLLGISTIIN